MSCQCSRLAPRISVDWNSHHKHRTEPVAFDAGLWIDLPLRDVTVEEHGVCTAQLAEQTGKIPEIHHLTGAGDCENSKEEAEREQDGEIPFGKMLRCLVSYSMAGRWLAAGVF